MNYRSGDTLYFLCNYTVDGVSTSPSAAPTYVIYRLTDLLGVNTWASGTATFTGLAGFYGAKLPATTVDTDGLYFCVFSTTDAAVDQRDLTVAGFKGVGGVNHLDTTVSTIPASVWSAATRTLTSGAAPSAADIWSYTARTLTAGMLTPSDVWGYATRTLTSGAAPSAADIWGYTTRTLTSYPTSEIRLSTIDYDYYLDRESKKELHVYQGDTIEKTLHILTSKNRPVDLTGATVTLYIGTAEGQIPDIVVEATVTDPPTAGVAELVVSSEDMLTLDPSITYVGNITIVWDETPQRVKTIWKSFVKILPVVSLAVPTP